MAKTDDMEEWVNFGWPEALAKALCDPHDYALGLEDGTVIRFQSASADSIDSPWVHLEDIAGHTIKYQVPDHLRGSAPFTLPRGIDVRVDNIAWVVDAPMGS